MPNRLDRLVLAIIESGRMIRDRLHDQRRGAACPYSHLQLALLRFIPAHDRPLMKDVAGYLRVAPPSATGFVDNLARAGLVRRGTGGNGDRRRVRLSLTPKGVRVLRQGFRALTGRLRAALEVLDVEDQEHLIAILKKLSRHL